MFYFHNIFNSICKWLYNFHYERVTAPIGTSSALKINNYEDGHTVQNNKYYFNNEDQYEDSHTVQNNRYDFSNEDKYKNGHTVQDNRYYFSNEDHYDYDHTVQDNRYYFNNDDQYMKMVTQSKIYDYNFTLKKS